MIFEVKKVNSGKDRFDEPFVEIILRTQDFSAMTLAKYVLQQKPMDVTINE